MSHELKVERLIDATPEEVFETYTDAEAQKGWFTILDPGMAVEVEVDLRVGGRWMSRWGFSPDQMFTEEQVFEVIDRPRRLVTRSTGSDPEGNTIDTHIDITFEDMDGKTLMTVLQTGFPSEETRDFFATEAWKGAFDRIQAYLEATRST